jgi:hypothetical protein
LDAERAIAGRGNPSNDADQGVVASIDVPDAAGWPLTRHDTLIFGQSCDLPPPTGPVRHNGLGSRG